MEEELVQHFNELKEKQISTMNHYRRIIRRLREKMSGRLLCECGRLVVAVRMESHKRAITHIRSMYKKDNL